MKNAIVIPSLEPNFRLINLIKKIQQYQSNHQIDIRLLSSMTVVVMNVNGPYTE